MYKRNDDSFMLKYNICKKYYEEHGNLLVPTNYIMDGVNIGSWIHSLRCSKKSGEGIIITADRIAMLDSIGMIWDSRDYFWMKKYYLIKEAYDKNKNINSIENSNIYYFLSSQRKNYKSGKLKDWQKKLLDDINFCWDRDDIWMDKYQKIANFYNIYKYYNFNLMYSEEECKVLNTWCENQRKKYRDKKLSMEQIELLNGINFKFEMKKKSSNLDWNVMYLEAYNYYVEHGDLFIKQKEGTLGRWIATQRLMYNKNELDRDKIIKLNNIGMVWNIVSNSKNYERSRILLINTLNAIRQDLEEHDGKKLVRKTIQYK